MAKEGRHSSTWSMAWGEPGSQSNRKTIYHNKKTSRAKKSRFSILDKIIRDVWVKEITLGYCLKLVESVSKRIQELPRTMFTLQIHALTNTGYDDIYCDNCVKNLWKTSKNTRLEYTDRKPERKYNFCLKITCWGHHIQLFYNKIKYIPYF